jgi:hypothetical protein
VVPDLILIRLRLSHSRSGLLLDELHRTSFFSLSKYLLVLVVCAPIEVLVLVFKSISPFLCRSWFAPV